MQTKHNILLKQLDWKAGLCRKLHAWTVLKALLGT
jgi:hypothetical protein